MRWRAWEIQCVILYRNQTLYQYTEWMITSNASSIKFETLVAREKSDSRRFTSTSRCVRNMSQVTNGGAMPACHFMEGLPPRGSARPRPPGRSVAEALIDTADAAPTRISRRVHRVRRVRRIVAGSCVLFSETTDRPHPVCDSRPVTEVGRLCYPRQPPILLFCALVC